MKITHINVSNFRGLQSIAFEPDKNVNVIVGPNAIGKSTILESIRLAKSLLSPRYFQEAQQALVSLGALSQHHQILGGQLSIDYGAIANDVRSPLEILIEFILDDTEIEELKSNVGHIALAYVRGRLARSDEQSQFAMTQYLSTPEGQGALDASTNEIKTRIEELERVKKLKLNLVFNLSTHSHFGKDIFSQAAISLLDTKLPANKTRISYFPADRAFPQGEVNIQIGSADAGNQIQSYIGQPGSKYQRLKQTIVQNIIANRLGAESLSEEFKIILEHLIPGKALDSIRINEIGLLKVLIKDIQTGKVFDIDSMSSGEKGIILTFLLIRQTLASGGILLIDEPELHLNPAVCKKMLPFLVEECVNRLNIQTFICTHSPEILGSAFDRDDCNLFHLRSGTDITKVFRQDQFEMFEALKRLGATTADVLFSKGNIFVEGEHDSDILTEGFFDLISGFKITQLGGRNEVEKEIKRLQASEEKGDVNKVQLFIFDLDVTKTDLSSSSFVRVKQWDRRCLENYLIDEKILFDQLSTLAKNKPESRGSFGREIKQLAMDQLTDVVAREIYRSLEPDNPGFRPSEIRGKSIDDIVEILCRRLLLISEQVNSIEPEKWKQGFIADFKVLMKNKSEEWDRDWIKVCDGKRLIQDLYRNYQINTDPLSFKKRIINQMKIEKNESWRVMQTYIADGLSM